MPIETLHDDLSDAIRTLFARMSKIETEEGRLKGLNYQPRPNDVVITTTPKAGTTWMQQICHQLRSADVGGDMSFEEISAVVPFVELAADQGQDLESPQYGESDGKPRLFKTHAWEEHCPKFPKTIVVVRHPYDVLVSFYWFFGGWLFDTRDIPIDDFAEQFWLARDRPKSRMSNASYFVHLVSWYERRDDPSVLFVFFEDLKEDLEKEIRRIGAFLSNEKYRFDRDDIVEVAVAHSTFEFMTQHSDQFDEKLSKRARNEAIGLSREAGKGMSKLVKGEVGSGTAVLSSDLQAKVDSKWESVVAPVTNCSTYDDLRQQFRAKR